MNMVSNKAGQERPSLGFNMALQLGKVIKTSVYQKALSDKAKAVGEKAKQKEVQLTFHNLNRLTVNIYVKDHSLQQERLVKTMQSMAMYTVQKGKAFAYQEWLIKIEGEELLQDDSYFGESVILRFFSNRNMHVKIPNGTAVQSRQIVDPMDSDDDERLAKVKFTNLLREFIDILDIQTGIHHQMRPNQALVLKTQRGNQLMVKSMQDMEIFSCFGASKQQDIQINQNKMHHLKRLESSKKINLNKKLKTLSADQSAKVNDGAHSQSQAKKKKAKRRKSRMYVNNQNDQQFIFDTLDMLQESQPTFFATDNMVDTICLTAEHHVMFFDQETNNLKLQDIKDDSTMIQVDINLFTKSQVTKIVKSMDNDKSFAVGCLDGSVYLLNSIDFSRVSRIFPTWKTYSEVRDSMQVNDIFADEKLVGVVHQNGVLAVYKRTSPGQETIEDLFNVECIFSRQFESPLKSIKVSSDSRFMVAYCEHRSSDDQQNIIQADQDEYIEFLVLYDLDNIKEPRLIGNIELNLDDNEQYSEKPQRLYQYFNQNQSLLIRSIDMLGVEEIILQEGRTKDIIENMHSKPILQIILMKDEKTLITAGRDAQIKVWNLNRKILIDTMVGHKSSVTALALSNDEKFMVSGSADGVILVWMCHNWVQLCQLEHDQTLVDVEEISISKDNVHVMAIDSCGVIASWQLKSDEFEKDSRPLKVSQDEIKSAIISNDQRYLVNITQNSIKIWDMELDHLDDLSRFFDNIPTNKGVKFSFSCKYLYFCIGKDSIVKYSVQDKSTESSYRISNLCKPITCFALESSDSYLYVITSSSDMIVFDVNEDPVPDQQPIHFATFDDSIAVKNIIVSADDSHAVMIDINDYLSYISLKNIDQPQIIELAIDTKIQNIMSILFTKSNNSQLFITSQDLESIVVYDLVLKMVVKQIDGHTYSPSQCFLFNKKQLVSFAKNEVIMWKKIRLKESADRIWKQQFVYPNTCKPVNTGSSVISGLIQNNRLILFNQQLVVQLTDDYGDLEEDFQLMETNREDNQQNVEGIDKVVKGPLNLLFPKILKMLQSGQVSEQNLIKYVDSVKANIIQPLNINMVHYFAASNNRLCVQRCFDLKMKYLRDVFDKTPLVYASEAKANESIEVIVNFLSRNRRAQENLTSKEICQLIKDSPLNLRYFFDNAFHIVDGSHIPRYGLIKGQPKPKSLRSFEGEKIPMKFWFTTLDQLSTEQFEEHFLSFGNESHHDHSSHNHSQDYMKKLSFNSAFSGHFVSQQQVDLPLVLKKLNFKYNFETGSVSSIKFHQALYDCELDDVFSSEVIQIILRYKWRKMTKYRNFRILMLLMYILFLIIKVFYESSIFRQSQFQNQRHRVLFADLFFNLYFLVLEAISVTGKWQLDGFSWILIARFYFPFFITLYVILDHFLDNDTFTLKLEYLMLINLVTWFKSITFLKFFTRTRIFIHLLSRILKEIKGFLEICLYSTLMFSSCFFIIKVQKIEATPEDVFDKSRLPPDDSEIILNVPELVVKFLKELWFAYLECYSIIYGVFATENYNNGFEYCLFILTSIFCTVILLNIVIAIMSDTYEHVMTNIVENDGREQNRIVLKKEAIMFWKRSAICSSRNGEADSVKQTKPSNRREHLYWLHYQTEQKKPWKSQLDHIVQIITNCQRQLTNNMDSVISTLNTQREARQDLEQQIMLRFEEGRRRQAVVEQQISDLSRKYSNQYKMIMDKFSDVKYFLDRFKQNKIQPKYIKSV